MEVSKDVLVEILKELKKDNNGINKSITLKTAIPLGLLILILPWAVKIIIDYGIQTNVLASLQTQYSELESRVEQNYDVTDIRIRKIETWKESHDVLYGAPRTILTHPDSKGNINFSLLTSTELINGDCKQCHVYPVKKKSVRVGP